MAQAKIFCEVTCNRCGALSAASAYYKNTSTISKLKQYTNDWIYDEDFGGNLCPSCQSDLRK